MVPMAASQHHAYVREQAEGIAAGIVRDYERLDQLRDKEEEATGADVAQATADAEACYDEMVEDARELPISLSWNEESELCYEVGLAGQGIGSYNVWLEGELDEESMQHDEPYPKTVALKFLDSEIDLDPDAQDALKHFVLLALGTSLDHTLEELGVPRQPQESSPAS